MDIHSQLHTIDFLVIAVYAVAVTGLGMAVSYRRRASDDLFLAGRSFGWPSVGLSIFATNVSPSFMIASCSVAYTSGMVAANFDWLAWWFLVLLAMVFVPYYLTTGISTMPEFMHRRFGKATYVFLSWYALFTTMILWLGGALYTGALLMSQIMGWPLWVAALVLTVVATSFTVAGGLAAFLMGIDTVILGATLPLPFAGSKYDFKTGEVAVRQGWVLIGYGVVITALVILGVTAVIGN